MEMDICFEGIGQIAATFRTEGEVQPGMAVALTKEGAVGMGADGALPCGVVLGGVCWAACAAARRRSRSAARPRWATAAPTPRSRGGRAWPATARAA